VTIHNYDGNGRLMNIAVAANNCTPLTPGCSNVPTAQQVKQFVQQQCLSQFNNSGAGGFINFWSMASPLIGPNRLGSTIEDVGGVGKTAIMSGQTVSSAYFPLPAGEVLNQVGSGSLYFWHKDWQGSARFASSVGNRASYFDRAFAPFGETYSNFGNSSGNNFTGDTQDTISGTYDTPNRELNPNQGRWISPDPAGLGAVDPGNPQTWNRYAYVGNNPLAYGDPLGLDRCLDANSDGIEDDAGGANDYSCALVGGTWVVEQAPTNVANVSTDVSRVPTLADDAEFFDLWASGVGPSTINYGPNDGMTRQLAGTNTFNKIRQTYTKNGCPDTSPSTGGALGTDHTGPWLEGYGTGNAALMQVGGFVAYGQTSGNVTAFTAVNVAGMASFAGETTWAPPLNSVTQAASNLMPELDQLYIPPTSMNDPYGSTGPYHNITQTFTWTESNLCKQGG
jgi:RHS repeat-associated protein